ncbi:interleukin-23 receptor [Sorex araneus]|uniref:interleukin-23 receptor n=1 Tax=Sorex araneus TaxID=42254 RepID=UPI002433F251|nr:interleukin-23 receptor [Sorex araneus]
MNQVIIQWDVVVALYVFFNWCHGGLTNINCSGRIWVEPATIFKMGMNISIYCQATLRNCQPKDFHFYKNVCGKKGFRKIIPITKINKTTALLRYSNFREPCASIFCNVNCPGYSQETLICGETIFSGYPPDVPDKVTCVIYEHTDNLTCTWSPGKPTYLDTKYVVHVKSLETEEEQQYHEYHKYHTSSYINISTDSLQGGKEYLVWVQATNVLGMEESEKLQIHLDDIVIPSATIIFRAEDLNTTVPKTVIHWTSQSTIEKISCEMRYNSTRNHSWTVKEFDANFSSVQQSEFFLEPNMKYVFQVRCQETGKKYWQAWSSPFSHQTPERGPEVTLNSFLHGLQSPKLLITSISKRWLAIYKQQDLGLLPGMILFAVGLSILSLIGILNRPLRTGIKRKLLWLTPKWFHEDIPNLENSNVVKTIQEKSKFLDSSSCEQVLYVDPVVTEIEFVLPEEHKPVDYTEENNVGSLETRDCLHQSLLTSTTVVYIPDINTGYKPQISNFLTGGNHLSNNDKITSPTLTSQVDPLDWGKNIGFQQYPDFAFSDSRRNSLRSSLFLEELSLILNPGGCNSLDRQDSQGLETTQLSENASPDESILEQTLLPDEFVSCLGVVNENLPSIHSYFPQNILENHFNRISHLKK